MCYNDITSKILKVMCQKKKEKELPKNPLHLPRSGFYRMNMIVLTDVIISDTQLYIDNDKTYLSIIKR